MGGKMKKILCLFLFLSCRVCLAEERFSGNVLPRFMALASNKVNARVGPNITYPVKYIYKRKFMPVVVVNEYYGWYQVKDENDDLSWIWKNYLTSKKYVMTNRDNVFLYKKGKLTSRILAKVNKGVIFFAEKCDDNFCKVKMNYNNKEFKGYILEEDLYGID